ncbi:hypothetical protein [Cytobacillus gottheilii]|uniref:Uncharacterized protein n=1 Tax=Cytobacillus gottheilii TaxID=859144 RepID=A0ABX8FIX8_9BACI|nr:hypothetical protein [Cytobacillus gottheilii]QVY63930.1 hypothetical protein J1899_22415 [Cytobacillus gottheilii]
MVAKTTTTPVKIEDHRHEKMKELAKKNNRTIQNEYAEAIDRHLAGKYQEMILADSKLEQIFTNKLNRVADRLAAMLSTNNMDTSTVLMGLMHLNSKEFEKDRNEMYQAYRKEAAAYEQAKRNKK